MESIRHFERTCGVPRRVIELPVAGTADLSERLVALCHARDAQFDSAVVIAEMSAVLNGALTRLDQLEDVAPSRPAGMAPGAIPPARTDIRRSSLSV